MAEPTVIQCSTACTVTVVHEISIPPFDLTVEQAKELGWAILLVWASAWAIRQVARLIDSPDEKESV